MKKLGLASRILLVLGLVWCALVEVTVAFVDRQFGFRLDGDWFLLLAASSPEEISEFFRTYSTELTLVIAGLVVLIAAIVALVIFVKGRGRWIFAAAVLGYLGWGILQGASWPPVFFAFDTLRGITQYRELLRAGTWDGELLPGVAEHPAGMATNVVVVLGESMTTDRMSLYGYAKPTTPCLAELRDRMSVMGPVRAVDTSTVKALRLMLTRATVEEPRRAVETAAVALRRRGYRPVLISAQPKWTRRCGVGQMLFAACETRIYLADNERGRGVWDHELVDYLKREVAVEDERPFAIFLHLQGSHFDPKYRVPPTFETPDGFDDYDRSVRYTDAILGAICKALPPRTVMVYVSDHGETPDAPSWRDARSPSLWKVPLVVYPKNMALPSVDSADHFIDLLLAVIGG